MVTVEAGRERHAAHYAGKNGGGHDLEWWVYPQAERHPVPEQIPANAEWNVGFLRNGIQYWKYIRVAPLSEGTCRLCAPQR